MLSETKHENNDLGLQNILEEYNLVDMKPKLSEAGVTADVIWLLQDEQLKDINLTKVDKLRLEVARQKYKDDRQTLLTANNNTYQRIPNGQLVRR